MRFVTDTHCLVWYLVGDRRLSSLSKDLFDKADRSSQVVIPTIVLAELLHLSRKHKIPVSFEETLKWLEKEERFEIYPLSIEILKSASPLTDFEMHDAIIVATASHLKIPLMTKDQKIIEADIVKVLSP